MASPTPRLQGGCRAASPGLLAMTSSSHSDVLIVGAGPAGLSLAISLAQAGFTTTVVEQQSEATLAHPAPDGREIALTHPSVATLQRLGTWAGLAPHEVGTIREAQVHDGPLGQRSALQLGTQGTGLEALGFIVPNHALRRTAYTVAARTPGVRIVTGAQVVRVATQAAHAELEYLPQPSADGAAAPPQRLQAPLLLAGERHAYPLVAVYAQRFADHRCALLGDAAVGMPPVTAHGYNLGLAGVERLTAAVVAARSQGHDIGNGEALATYARAHHRHAWPMYEGTNAIVRLYTDTRPVPRLLRQLVLQGARRLPPLQAAIVGQLTGKAPVWAQLARS